MTVPITITPKGYLDYHRCPRLWEYAHFHGNSRISLPMEERPYRDDIEEKTLRSVQTTEFRNRAREQFKATKISWNLTASVPAPVDGAEGITWEVDYHGHERGWVLLSTDLCKGENLVRASDNADKDITITMAMVIVEAAIGAPLKGAVVYAFKFPTLATRPKAEPDPHEYMERCVKEMCKEGEEHKHFRRVHFPRDDALMKEALASLNAFTISLSVMVGLWERMEITSFPVLRNDRKCQICQFRRLCWHGELHGYQDKRATPLEEIHDDLTQTAA